jgi:hypothetical protein
VIAMPEHPWKLVAPWYRWERQRADENRRPPETRPVFQKFDAPDFVRGFVRDPQRSLAFDKDIDTVFQTHTCPADPKTGRISRMLALTVNGKKSFHAAHLCPTGVRKLYLDTHKRYYLVVCELHCDAPGFPMVGHKQVCQAGFVVRRRSTEFPTGLRKEAEGHLKGVFDKQAAIAYLDGSTPLRGSHAAARDLRVQKLRAAGKYESTLGGLKKELADARAELAKWKDVHGTDVLEGWIPGGFPNVGSWQPVAEKPDVLLESFFPLYRLFPDPKLTDHPATHGTIYYGVVPTSSLDTDPTGTARFDPTSRYEVRCFVRRHAPECPPTKAVPDCHGPLVWSGPTERYQLAAPSDLIGTSQRPVTIHIPDLRELAAQAAGLELNKFAPMKVVQPQNLDFKVNDQKAEGGKVKQGGFPQICFFAIPLITIIAFFVLRLFLPVVVFLFQLYFLLAFRLCILPSVSIAGGLKTKLDLIPPSLDVDAGVDFAVAGLPFTAAQLGADLQANAAADAGVTLTPTQLAELGQSPNAPLYAGAKIAFEAEKIGEAAADTAGVNATAGLHYETVQTWPPQ